MTSPSPESTAPKELRVSGLAVLFGIVALGLVSSAGYYHYKSPKLAAEHRSMLEKAPKTREGRLAAWHEIGAPQIHHRLSKFARFSTELPWLVTHAVVHDDGGDPELFGIDCEALPLELSRIEELTVVVDLPRPRSLGRHALVGDMALRVPRIPPGRDYDAERRLVDLARHLLGGIPAALEKDIEDASLVFRIGGELVD